MATWILTGSPDNFEATRERGFRLIGAKERKRPMAERIEVGDEIVLYLTQIQVFAGIIRVTSEMFEDREKVWPGKPGKVDPYPWRFETEPVVVLDENSFVPAEDVALQLEHVQKWPPEHWKLAFQGQLRTVSEADAKLLGERLRAAAPTAA